MGPGREAAFGPLSRRLYLTTLEAPMEDRGDMSLTAEQKAALLSLARRAIVCAVEGRTPPAIPREDPALQTPRGAFVTVYCDGQLRGCVGLFAGEQPLVDVVAHVAVAAALHDGRFLPIQRDELGRIKLMISVFTELKIVTSPDQIVLGRDGVHITQGGKSGTLLPHVAVERGWDVETLLSKVCELKAGLPSDAWRRGATIEVYQAEQFGDV